MVMPCCRTGSTSSKTVKQKACPVPAFHHSLVMWIDVPRLKTGGNLSKENSSKSQWLWITNLTRLCLHVTPCKHYRIISKIAKQNTKPVVPSENHKKKTLLSSNPPEFHSSKPCYIQHSQGAPHRKVLPLVGAEMRPLLAPFEVSKDQQKLCKECRAWPFRRASPWLGGLKVTKVQVKLYKRVEVLLVGVLFNLRAVRAGYGQGREHINVQADSKQTFQSGEMIWLHPTS